MPEEGKTTLVFQNYRKQMKLPYVIYADFEALIIKFLRCERAEGQKVSNTEKTELHEACGFSFMVVRSNGRASKPFVYRGENAMELFFKELLKLEKALTESLATPKSMVMTAEYWEKHKNAEKCHICNESLDSLPV